MGWLTYLDVVSLPLGISLIPRDRALVPLTIFIPTSIYGGGDMLSTISTSLTHLCSVTQAARWTFGHSV